jgi:D-alanyl-D-alanine carboxypeptidase/D-alanyl-D-alanine-endopeptidase (penicillin-binding protein 4)
MLGPVPAERPVPLVRTLVFLLMLCAAAAGAQTREAPLPEPVAAALRAAKLPPAALGVVVLPLSASGLELRHNAAQAFNPASTMKLVTTLAGLELLGPQYQWRTDALASAPVRDGVLEGDLTVRGRGDPEFVIENLWLLTQRLRGAGVREIRGDLVLDRSAFAPVAHDPAAFDGESLRPYNAGPDALLLNFKAVSLNFEPQPDGSVRVWALPALAGTAVPASVRGAEGPCNDWRGRLGADFADPARLRFAGAFPISCGPRVWHLSLLDPTRYFEAVFRALWEGSGGGLRGRVREGAAPADARVLATQESRALAEVIRDINKFSNNVMARQLFLTLALEGRGAPARVEQARAVVGDWLGGRGVAAGEVVLDNGSGLSRSERITPLAMGRLLSGAWQSPLMPEFVASLPLVGVDGTMRKRNGAAGSAHIKTGQLADARAIAGYVLAASGRRYAVVGFINHANAQGGAAVLDALLNWVYVGG